MWLKHPNGTLWNTDGKPSLEASLREQGAVETDGPVRAAEPANDDPSDAVNLVRPARKTTKARKPSKPTDGTDA